MQPNNQPQDWQQPSEQPSQAPYVATPADVPAAAPIVTLQPESVDQVSPEQQPVIDDDPDLAANDQQPVRWQAAEYIQRAKSPLWFIVFGIVFLGFMAISIFLIDSITFTILVPVMAASLLVYAYRPPRILEYTLSRQGLHINDHLYPFADFKSFGVIKDDGEYSVMLVPTKRFKPGVSVYFPEEAGEAIVDLLGVRLPMKELHLDLVDRVIRKLRI